MIYFNGEATDIPGGITLEALLRAMGRNPALTVVTVDGRFVPVSEYRATAVPEGAKVTARELLDGG